MRTAGGARVAGRAIAVREAALADGAAEASTEAATIDVGFEAVLSVVDALARDAQQRDRIARVRAAVAVDTAPQACRAARTDATATVDGRLEAVGATVGALVRHAGE